jgi:molybdopterin-guanine dinucleotide biosynthesis protein A
MTGVVLCGGLSTRMGTDKGLLKRNGLTWVETAARKLSSLQIPVVISVNQSQLGAYSNIFPSNELIVDDKAIPVKGPLLGLLSVHKNNPGEDLLVLACDMIAIDQTLLCNLLDYYKKVSCEAYVYKTAQKLQPLCGIYTSKGLEKISVLLRRQQLQKFSMMYVLDTIDTKCLEPEASLLPLFNNYNSVEDLKAYS